MCVWWGAEGGEGEGRGEEGEGGVFLRPEFVFHQDFFFSNDQTHFIFHLHVFIYLFLFLFSGVCWVGRGVQGGFFLFFGQNLFFTD